MMVNRLVFLTFAVSLALPSPARSDEIDDLVNTLKPASLNYAVWAESLLKAAEKLSDKPAAQRKLYSKAYELGTKHRKGYSAATRAARAMLDLSDADRDAWQRKLLDVLRRNWRLAPSSEKLAPGNAYVKGLVEAADDLLAAGQAGEAAKLYADARRMAKQYAAGRQDEIDEKLREAGQRQRVDRSVAQCERLLKANPQNAAARSALVRLYLVERDDPAKAKELLTADVPEALRTFVPLSAKDVGGLPKGTCVELGTWLQSLATGASSQGKANVLTRAKACYERAVELEADDVKAAVLKARLSKVAKALAAAGPGRLASRQKKTLILDLGKGVVMRLVLIPAGKFVMGAPASDTMAKTDEKPQRRVAISRPFYMAVTEVTQAQWSAVMPDEPWTRYEKVPRGGSFPVVGMRGWGAEKFCKQLTQKVGRAVRLPTEAEWEYACRAGSRGRFCFGDSGPVDLYAWHKTNSGGKFHEVGRRRPNAWGLYDMHGNVMEFCADFYDPKRYASKGDEIDPFCPAPPAGTDSFQPIRGGSFSAPAADCRSSARGKAMPGWPQPWVGFRVIVPIDDDKPEP